jgi:hypothetical protein
MKRGERSWLVVSLPAFTKCQRRSESALAHPTQEPVEPWSAIVHQLVRRSFELGTAAVAAAATSAREASSNVQSSSVFRDGLQFRILFCRRALVVRRRVVFRGRAMSAFLL